MDTETPLRASTRFSELGLPTKLLLAIAGVVLFISLLVFVENARLTNQQLLKDADRYAITVLHEKSNQISLTLQAVAARPTMLAEAYSKGLLDEHALLKLLPNMIEGQDNIFGSALALTKTAQIISGIADPAAYFYRKDGQIEQISLANDDYDYRSLPWFKKVEQSYIPQWSEPYFDEGGGDVLMTTYSVPLMNEGHFVGVATADVTLTWLSTLMQSLDTKVSGYAYIISKAGLVLAHPNAELLLADVSKQSTTETKNYLQQLIARHSVRTDRIAHDPVLNTPGRLFTSTMTEQGWTVGIVLSESELLAPAKKQSQRFWVISLIGLALLLGLIYLILRHLLHPLLDVAAAADELGHGNFDHPLPEGITHDEIGRLINAFKRMQQDIKVYIHDKTEAELKSQALRNEMSIAHEIQMAMVPKHFPTAMDTSGNNPLFEFAAKLVPAKGIGGDFYDAFAIDENRIFFCLGDVSGKGVPAALFMAKTVTLLRAIAGNHTCAVEILAHANKELRRNNHRFMFVTLVAGIVDRRTGMVSLVNAGHLPLIQFKHLGDTFGVEKLALPVASPLGVREDCQLEEVKLNLQEQHGLLIYSDGIVEAIDHEQEQFGEERLLNFMTNHLSDFDSIQVLTSSLVSHVQHFEQEKDPHDDISVLCLWSPGDWTEG